MNEIGLPGKMGELRRRSGSELSNYPQKTVLLAKLSHRIL